jgi:hypothetical protein
MTKFSPLAVATVVLLAAQNASAFTGPKPKLSALGALHMVSNFRRKRKFFRKGIFYG